MMDITREKIAAPGVDLSPTAEDVEALAKRIGSWPPTVRTCDDAAAALLALRTALSEAERRAETDAATIAARDERIKALVEPTHRHVKTGGLYRIVGEGRIEADLSPVTIYQAKNGDLWVRPTAEFNDGRFVEIHDLDRFPARTLLEARP